MIRRAEISTVTIPIGLAKSHGQTLIKMQGHHYPASVAALGSCLANIRADRKLWGCC